MRKYRLIKLKQHKKLRLAAWCRKHCLVVFIINNLGQNIVWWKPVTLKDILVNYFSPPCCLKNIIQMKPCGLWSLLLILHTVNFGVNVVCRCRLLKQVSMIFVLVSYFLFPLTLISQILYASFFSFQKSQAFLLSSSPSLSLSTPQFILVVLVLSPRDVYWSTKWQRGQNRTDIAGWQQGEWQVNPSLSLCVHVCLPVETRQTFPMRNK